MDHRHCWHYWINAQGDIIIQCCVCGTQWHYALARHSGDRPTEREVERMMVQFREKHQHSLPVKQEGK